MDTGRREANVTTGTHFLSGILCLCLVRLPSLCQFVLSWLNDLLETRFFWAGREVGVGDRNGREGIGTAEQDYVGSCCLNVCSSQDVPSTVLQYLRLLLESLPSSKETVCAMSSRSPAAE